MEPVFETAGTCLTILLPAELDHPASDIIRRESDRIMGRIYIRTINFDFRRTTFMDSSGIGLLVGRNEKITYLGGRTIVTNVCPRIQKILQFAGLDQELCILQCEDSRAE